VTRELRFQVAGTYDTAAVHWDAAAYGALGGFLAALYSLFRLIAGGAFSPDVPRRWSTAASWVVTSTVYALVGGLLAGVLDGPPGDAFVGVGAVGFLAVLVRGSLPEDHQ
jgi:hypothetical protein